MPDKPEILSFDQRLVEFDRGALIDELTISTTLKTKQGLAKLASAHVLNQLDNEMIAKIHNARMFFEHRASLGEYDTAAGPIIELARTSLRLAEIQRIIIKSLLDILLADIP